MAYETRLTVEYSYGTLSAAASASSTVLSSEEFARGLPAGLSSTVYVPVTLQDPSAKVAEVVWVVSHAASATSCTVVRGREGTSARAWDKDALWTVPPTRRDLLLSVANRAALPTDPHVGLRCYLQDEQVAVTWRLGVGWLSDTGWGYRQVVLLGVDGTVTFSGIPATLKMVQVAYSGRSSGSGTAVPLILRVNGDAASVYGTTLATQTGTAAAFAEESTTSATVGLLAGTSAPVGRWAAGHLTLPGWNAPGGRGGLNWMSHANIGDPTNNVQVWHAGCYRKAGPYTSLQFLSKTGNIKAGSEFAVYGWS